MSTELRDALGAVGDAARADFEARDAAEVIAPANKRVRRARATMVVGSAAGVMVLASGLLWGLDVLGTTGLKSLEPATPNPTWEPPDVTGVLSETPWSTLSLAAVAEPRAIGEKRADSVAGMICHHAKPDDDPRVAIDHNPDLNTSGTTSIEDCTPVWFKDGPFTSVNDLALSTGSPGWSLSTQALVRNDSDRPLAIDTDSVYAWLETAPDESAEVIDGVYSHTMVGTSMWGTAGDNTALLRSDSATTVLRPGEALPIATLASDGMEGTGPLARLLDSGKPYSVSFWARIHEENPTGDATYLIELGRSGIFGGTDGN